MNHTSTSTQKGTERPFAPLSRVFNTTLAMMVSVCLFPMVVLLAAPVVHAQSADSSLACRGVHVPVALAPGQPQQYQIFGELCTRNQAATVVQVLLPGASYSHLYWNFQPQTYSYVAALTSPNYSTFNIDRLSNGQSSQPDSSLVTLDADAYTVHQIVQALRQGTIGGVAFAKVVLVGHSLGSYVLWDEAASYQDVDGLIVTGALHKSSPSNVNQTFGFVYPATQDPKFQDSGLDAGYYTTIPGDRQPFFYHSSDADPNVISTDEGTKDVFVLNEVIAGADPGNLARTAHITVPVLVVVGQFDFIFCATDGTDCSSDQSVQAAEAQYYPPQACLEAHILPGSGHDINLHLNAQDWFGMARKWLNKFFGDDPPQPGHCS
jgi:pimeloyl-ACP methyl ester carboxylesterase